MPPKNKGQALTEFVLGLLVSVPLCLGVLAIGATLMASAWLRVETFSKARAALYNQNATCQPSRAVRNLPLFNWSYLCSTNGNVRGTLSFGKEFLATESLGALDVYSLNLRPHLSANTLGVGL